MRYNVREQMRRARKDVTLVSPYLIPGKAGLEVMHEITRRGVKIETVTNSLAATDEPLVHAGYRHYRPDMLRLGVQLYEISSVRTRRSVRLGLFGTQVGRLHAKAAVIDRRTLYVGSMNFDPRSEIHNTEIGIIAVQPRVGPAGAEAGRRVQAAGLLQGAVRAGRRTSACNGWAEIRPRPRYSSRTRRDLPDRLMLELVAPFTPESML